MQETIQAILNAAVGEVAKTGEDSKALEALRVRYLGRKGEFSRCFKELALASAEERPRLGQLLNAAKAQVEEVLNSALERAREGAARPAERLDVTVPGRLPLLGRIHPITQVAREIAQRQGTELFVHGRDGRIRERDSHGHDPHPPRG